MKKSKVLDKMSPNATFILRFEATHPLAYFCGKTNSNKTRTCEHCLRKCCSFPLLFTFWGGFFPGLGFHSRLSSEILRTHAGNILRKFLANVSPWFPPVERQKIAIDYPLWRKQAYEHPLAKQGSLEHIKKKNVQKCCCCCLPMLTRGP